MVTNEHLGKCVRMCLTNIQIAGNQSNMETHSCKYGSSISCLSEIALKMGMVSVFEVEGGPFLTFPYVLL